MASSCYKFCYAEFLDNQGSPGVAPLPIWRAVLAAINRRPASVCDVMTTPGKVPSTITRPASVCSEMYRGSALSRSRKSAPQLALVALLAMVATLLNTSTAAAGQASRTISLFASANEVVYPTQVTLSGQIVSPEPSCEDADELVRIRRRVFGDSEYRDFEVAATDAGGRFELSFVPKPSADYVAVAPGHDDCADATSSVETVVVQVKVTIGASREEAPRGSTIEISGRVRPNHVGTNVALQRRRGAGEFVTVHRDQLNERSRYRFSVEVNWKGRRVFRTLWRAQDDDHLGNRSERIVIRGTRRA